MSTPSGTRSIAGSGWRCCRPCAASATGSPTARHEAAGAQDQPDPGGRIRVEIGRENGAIRLAVHDTGIGIDAAAIPHLFERFYRADRSRSGSASSEGAGVGLALVAWIAERHDATVAVSSHPGEGSTFSVRFPSPPSR